MAARQEGVIDQLDRVGIGAFTPAEARQLFAQALQRDATQVGVVVVDWERWTSSGRGNNPRFEALRVADSGGGRLAEILQLADEQRVEAVETILVEKLASIMHTDPERIDTSLSLENMGIDSLMAVELVSALHAEVGVELSAMVMSQGHDVSGLALYILKQIVNESTAESPPDPETGAAEVTETTVEATAEVAS